MACFEFALIKRDLSHNLERSLSVYTNVSDDDKYFCSKLSWKILLSTGVPLINRTFEKKNLWGLPIIFYSFKSTIRNPFDRGNTLLWLWFIIYMSLGYLFAVIYWERGANRLTISSNAPKILEWNLKGILEFISNCKVIVFGIIQNFLASRSLHFQSLSKFIKNFRINWTIFNISSRLLMIPLLSVCWNV